ncbi:MAG: hypothetical protein WBZ48_15125 [Bacteroidota bacterium]
MFDKASLPRLCFLVLLGIVACRDVGVPDVCVQKISARLLHELSNTGVNESKYRVIIRLRDSTGLTQVVPSITIASTSLATGFLTASEIRKVCVLSQVLFVDLPKRYHPLEQQ